VRGAAGRRCGRLVHARRRRDCPIPGDRLGLIVVSHGYGGNYLGHHDTAEVLADGGFVVVALNHPDDTRRTRIPSPTPPPWSIRPTDVKRLIDFMLGAGRTRRESTRAGSASSAFRAGATRAWSSRARRPTSARAVRCPKRRPVCAPPTDRRAGLTTAGPAVVIADPLSFFPTRDSLKDVRVPLQLWASERGGDGVHPRTWRRWRAICRAARLSRRAGTAHFAFLAPARRGSPSAVPQICTDDAVSTASPSMRSSMPRCSRTSARI
jgi:hypothetical protein